MYRVCILTLGCKVNQCESGRIASRICEEGDFCVTDRLVKSDLYIINTCAVTGFAEKKSRYELSRILRLDDCAKVIICGCASKLNEAQFSSPNVIATFGTDKDGVGQFAVQFLKSELPRFGCGGDSGREMFRNRRKAYIKVQDGCENFCSYCIVPHLRGRSRSRGIEEVVREVKEARAEEIVIVGINLSAHESLGALCTQVDKCGKKFELSSLEAGVLTSKFLKVLYECENFVPRFHLSLQSGSDSVLRAMNRRYSAAEFFDKVQLLREFFPSAVISADVICGFPAESEQDFEDTKQFLSKVGFSHVHVFPYSPRPGTPASKMPQIKPSVVTARSAELVRLFS